MKDNPTFSMVNESDEDDEDMEDDSETGAMLRPSADRSGNHKFQFPAFSFHLIMFYLLQFVLMLCYIRKNITLKVLHI